MKVFQLLVEYATLEWVAWYNSQRLMGPLGYVPPAEYEDQYHRAQTAPAVLVLNSLSLRQTRGDSVTLSCVVLLWLQTNKNIF